MHAFTEIVKKILAADLTDGAKLAALAYEVGAQNAREASEICKKSIRTMERHFADMRVWREKHRNIAEEAEKPPQNCGGGYADLRTDDLAPTRENNSARDLRNHLTVVSSNPEVRKDPPLTPPSPVQTRSWEDDCAARRDDDYSGVIFENDKVTLVNGTRQLWLDKFGGDAEDLELALIDAAGTVQVNNRSTPIATQVQRRLAIIVRDRREKDKRYAAAVAQNRKADKPKAAFKPSRW